MLLRIGDTFAGYRVLRLLGAGGMGEVYLVQHPRLPRQDALKVLRSDVSNDPSFRERFVREADLAAGLRHPHIVRVQDRGEYEGQLWIAMDYIVGTDASELMTQRYPAGMPVDVVASVVTAVASALDYAHRSGLLHRDVKPANIIVADLETNEPQVHLADFGIARALDGTGGITTTNMTVGTVAYAAPEQLMGEEMDGRADQYALAASAYHLLAGSQLFPHSNAAVVISRHLNAPMPALANVRPDLAPLDPVMAAALAKNPDDRFACCTDFARALTETTADQGPRVAAARTTPAPAARRSYDTPASPEPVDAPNWRGSVRFRKQRLIGASVAALLLLFVAGLLWRPWQHPQSSTAVSSSTSVTVPSTETAAASPQARTPAAPVPPPPTSTIATPSETTPTAASNPNGPGCSSRRPDKCGPWTPEQAVFACRAIVGGADYTAELRDLLMNRYGLDQTSAFFLGKEAWYSVSSNGYIDTGSMADGPHPLCNDVVP